MWWVNPSASTAALFERTRRMLMVLPFWSSYTFIYLSCRCRCLFDLPVGPNLNVFLFVAFFQLRSSVLCLPADYFDFLYPGRSVSNSWLTFLCICSGVSPCFAVKLFKSWLSEKDINSVAASLRKVGMDNRLMVRTTSSLQHLYEA